MEEVNITTLQMRLLAKDRPINWFPVVMIACLISLSYPILCFERGLFCSNEEGNTNFEAGYELVIGSTSIGREFIFANGEVQQESGNDYASILFSGSGNNDLLDLCPENTLNQYGNCLWMVWCTMTTVGYGGR